MKRKVLQRVLSVMILIILAIGCFILLQNQEVTPGRLWDTVAQTSYQRPVYSYQHALTTLWNANKRDYVEEGTNRIVEIDNQSLTTSLGVSQMLTQAVYEDDKNTFDGMLEWVTSNMILDEEESFAFVAEWGENSVGEWTVIDDSVILRDNAFILQALAFGKYRWATSEYDEYIYSMGEYIWGNHITQLSGRNLVYSYRIDDETVGLRVSDLTPQVYKVIAPIDTFRDWESLIPYAIEYGGRASDSIEFSDLDAVYDLRYIYEFKEQRFELERYEEVNSSDTILSDLAWYQVSLMQYNTWFDDSNLRFANEIQEKFVEFYEEEFFWELDRELRMQILMAIVVGDDVLEDVDQNELFTEHFEPLYNTGDRTWFDETLVFSEKHIAWTAMATYHNQLIQLSDETLYER